MDDDSRYIILWKLCANMKVQVATDRHERLGQYIINSNEEGQHFATR